MPELKVDLTEMFHFCDPILCLHKSKFPLELLVGGEEC